MKQIIIQVLALICLVFSISGIDFNTRPFFIRFTNPFLALGFILIVIGVFFIYWQGHINANK